MNMNRALIIAGTTTLILNAAIYNGLHDDLRWHGALQVVLGLIGGITAIVGLWRDGRKTR